MVGHEGAFAASCRTTPRDVSIVLVSKLDWLHSTLNLVWSYGSMWPDANKLIDWNLLQPIDGVDWKWNFRKTKLGVQYWKWDSRARSKDRDRGGFLDRWSVGAPCAPQQGPGQSPSRQIVVLYILCPPTAHSSYQPIPLIVGCSMAADPLK